MSKICKNCGKENKEEFDFCVYCGNELPKHLICLDCKEEYLESDYEFCGKCGGKLIPFDSFNETKHYLSEKDICKIFWKEFFKEAEKTDNNFFGGNKDAPYAYNRFSMKGVMGSVLETRGWYKKDDHIEIKILIHHNKDLYHHLKKREDYYNKQFIKNLVWREKKNACNIALIIDGLSFENRSNWEEIIHQFITQMNRFCEVFSEDIIEFLK